MARDLIQTFPHQDQHAQYKATSTPTKAHTPYQCYPTKEIQRFQTKLIKKKKKKKVREINQHWKIIFKSSFQLSVEKSQN